MPAASPTSLQMTPSRRRLATASPRSLFTSAISCYDERTQDFINALADDEKKRRYETAHNPSERLLDERPRLQTRESRRDEVVTTDRMDLTHFPPCASRYRSVALSL